MKLAIMQPYFMPYIGYWQMINAVDEYVIYDDVNFIKGGWINRNRIVNNGKVQFFNIQLQGASPNKLINEVQLSNNKNVIEKNLRILEASYSQAPYFNEVYAMLKEIFYCNEDSLVNFLEISIRRICEYLKINTLMHISSKIEKDNALKGEEKVISICKILRATDYCNSIGGKALYSVESFKKNQIGLSFLEAKPIFYKQFNAMFVPNLSIIDVMMFNSVKEINEMLKMYKIS